MSGTGSQNRGVLLTPPFPRAPLGAAVQPDIHNQAMAAIERAFVLTNPLGLFFQVGRGSAASPQGLLYESNIPTSDPGIAGVVWLSNGVFVVSGAAAVSSPVQKLSLLAFRNVDGTPITTTQTAGKFAYSVVSASPVSSPPTAGGPVVVLGEVTNNSGPVTDVMTAFFTLPPTYQSGANFNVLINARVLIVAGATITTATVQPLVYLVAANGTLGANLGGAAQTITTSAVQYTFAVTGTGLVAGSQFRLDIAGVLTTSGSQNAAIRVGSVWVQ